MRQALPLVMALLVMALLVAPIASAGDKDYYLSVPLLGGIYRLDAETLQPSPFALGLLIPFYGFWTPDGRFFVPDQEWGAVFEIDGAGNVGVLAAGGTLESPVTVTPDPSGGMVVSDLPLSKVVHIEESGEQTLIHDAVTSGGLIDGPGGVAFDREGNLYVANNVGHDIVKIDPAGNISLFSDSPLICSPGGMAIDGSGNMFVAMYAVNTIVRFRLDTGEAEVFSEDLSFMLRPNDVKLSRSGGLLTTTKLSNLLRIDARGNIDEIFRDPTFGEIVGIAVPEDANPCLGSFVPYGEGTAGSGGEVPRLNGIFSPCPGQDVGLEFRNFLGGTAAYLIFGVQPAATPLLGGTLLVDLAAPNALIPFPMPGSGPGDGNLVLSFTVTDDASLVGANFYIQALAADPGAPLGVSFSNGLEETIAQ